MPRRSSSLLSRSARAHQVHPNRLARAHQVAQRLLLATGDADRDELACQQQPHEVLSIAAVGLDALGGRARDLARRRNHTLHATGRQLARQPVAGRPRLVGRAHRPRQPRTQPRRPGNLAAQPKHLQLARLGVKDRRHNPRGVHVQADEGSSLRHGWLLLCGHGAPRGYQPCGNNITPRPSRGTGRFYASGRTEPSPILSRAPRVAPRCESAPRVPSITYPTWARTAARTRRAAGLAVARSITTGLRRRRRRDSRR